MEKEVKRLKLHGFNNLTKSLSFNMYDICYTKTVADREAYLQYIDEQYNADRLTEGCLHSVGAEDNSSAPGPLPETVLAHLDKSHITVHTYPEYNPIGGISTFRADIDVSTCGEISPLKALNYLIHSFDTDIMTIDYRVRGFTRDITGHKLFIDHNITSIQDYIPELIKEHYQMIDVNVYQENIFHTKCKLKDFDLDNYLFGLSKEQLHPGEVKRIEAKLRHEIYGPHQSLRRSKYAGFMVF